jgi:hypothetical protein
VEVFAARHRRGLPVLRAFAHPRELDAYLPGLRLPGWLQKFATGCVVGAWGEFGSGLLDVLAEVPG